MKTIERYVFGSFLSSFLLAFAVLSFVLTIGLLVQIVGFVMDGVPMSLVSEFCMVSFPETLQWSMPLSLLVSSILVFSRLSADSEISAMRACGINILTVARWPILFGLFCTLLGFWVNNEIVPRGHEVRRTLKSKVSIDAGLSFLEPGRIISDIPNVKLYFQRKEGNWLYDVYARSTVNSNEELTVHAAKALVTQEGSDICFDIYRPEVYQYDGKRWCDKLYAMRYPYVFTDAIRGSKYKRRPKDFRFAEMCGLIRTQSAALDRASCATEADRQWLEHERRDLSENKVELGKRFVFALASLCFVLVGIPLGIRSQRRDSTVGMAISLAVSLGYYVVIILLLSCQKMYGIHPEYLIWLPVAGCLALAAKLIRRHM